MNLKEAFRFQNKLQAFLEEAQDYLLDSGNVLRVEVSYLRKRVFAEAEDETVTHEKSSQYAGGPNEMMDFLLYLLAQREQLSAAIHSTKAALPIDMDSQVSLNTGRQRAAAVFRHLVGLRASETILSGGGTGYRFNADGNQVTYRCDARKVTTIDFDRNAAKRYLAMLNRQADEMSVELDRALINSTVDYTIPFDVNASFADAFEDWLNAQAAD